MFSRITVLDKPTQEGKPLKKELTQLPMPYANNSCSRLKLKLNKKINGLMNNY